MAESPSGMNQEPTNLVSTQDDVSAGPSRKTSLGHNRAFDIFWLGQTLSNFGDSFAMIAFPLLVFHATQSLVQMGLISATFGAGHLIASLFAGVLVDRVDRRRLMIACDLGRAAIFVLLTLCWWSIGPSIILIYLAAGLSAMLDMGFQVAQVTAVANLVEPDQIGAGNGRLQASAGFCFVIGPTLAGFVSAQFGPITSIAIDALTFLISAVSLALIHIPQQARATAQATMQQLFKEWKEGTQYLFSHPIQRTLVYLFTLMIFIMGGSLDIFIFYIKHNLGQDDGMIGIIFGLASLGAVIAGVAGADLRKRLGFGVCLLGGIALASLSALGIGLVTSLVAIAVLAALNVFSETLRGMTSMTYRQQVTPDHLLGRVSAAFITILAIVGPIGAAITTSLASFLGPTIMLVIMGIAGTLLAVLGLFTKVRLKHPEQELHPQDKMGLGTSN